MKVYIVICDDKVIIGKSPEELQHSLNLLHEYCENSGLEVNASKTKIVVFRKRGPVKVNRKMDV